MPILVDGEDHLHGGPHFRIVLAPKIPGWRIASGFANGRNDRIGRLNALRRFQLSEVVSGRQQDQPGGINDGQAVSISIVAEQQGPVCRRHL